MWLNAIAVSWMGSGKTCIGGERWYFSVMIVEVGRMAERTAGVCVPVEVPSLTSLDTGTPGGRNIRILDVEDRARRGGSIL